MGNTLSGKKIAKVMKVNGETKKFKTPIEASEVLKDYPSSYVLLESETVKHFGIRAKPLEPKQQLLPKRLYFLLELPKGSKERGPRRVKSGINMCAKDRLESLMLTRRSTSDLSSMKPTSIVSDKPSEDGAVRVRMRLPKAELERLMKESKDEVEAAKKIMDHCFLKRSNNNNNNNDDDGNNQCVEDSDMMSVGSKLNQQMHFERRHGRVREGIKARERRVSFRPINEEIVQIAVAS